MTKTSIVLFILCGAMCVLPLLVTGCSKDIMYGADGRIIEMDSPDDTLEIEIDDDEIEIEGARGIGRRSRIPLPGMPIDDGDGPAGNEGVTIPPLVSPSDPAGSSPNISIERKTQKEERMIVR